MLARRRARKEAAEGEVRARDRAEVPLSEVNHRVANRFVNLQKNAVSDRVAKDALEETQARIRARRGRLV
jgi:two-component sensor histidine kinase